MAFPSLLERAVGRDKSPAPLGLAGQAAYSALSRKKSSAAPAAPMTVMGQGMAPRMGGV